MAITATVNNRCKFDLGRARINFSSDQFITVLFAAAVTVNIDTMHGYGALQGFDPTTQELATANGYTQAAKILAGVSYTEDDTDNRAETTWTNPSWTASGGNIGPTPAAGIYDNTATDKPFIFFVDFGGNQTAATGTNFVINNLAFNIG